MWRKRKRVNREAVSKIKKEYMDRGGTFQVWNLKKLKECCNFSILEGTYGMYFVLTVSGRNLQVGTFQKCIVELTYIWNFEI